MALSRREFIASSISGAVIAGLAGLMTGMYPQRTGLRMSYRWQGINPNMRTLAVCV